MNHVDLYAPHEPYYRERPCLRCGGTIRDASPYARACHDCKVENNRKLQARRRLHHIPAAVRAAVMERDAGVCQRCRCEIQVGRRDRYGHDRNPELDHITPLARGGDSSESNLQLLCRRCNRSKGTR